MPLNLPGLHLTSQQEQLSAQYLRELARTGGTTEEKILSSAWARKILSGNKLSQHQKGEMFFKSLRALRYPRLTGTERKFASVSHRIYCATGIKTIAPQNFEGDGIFLSFNALDPSRYAAAAEKLRRHKKDIGRLFRIMSDG